MDEIQVCAKMDCEKRRIFGSQFCGQHTDNDTFLRTLVSALAVEKEQKCEGLLISEIELEESLEVRNRTFKDCEFNDIQFQHLKLYDCNFISCFFIDCELFESSFISCGFEDCEWDEGMFSEVEFRDVVYSNSELNNTVFNDNSELNGCEFNLCKLSNVDIYSITCSRETRFIESIFSRCSIYESGFDGVSFLNTEFDKTAITYSSFRDANLLEIKHDFDTVGPPLACDFFAAKFDSSLIPLFNDTLNNVSQDDKVEYLRDVISQITKNNHPNYLPELNYFLTRYESMGFSLLDYKQVVIEYFKKLYQHAIELNNPSMAGEVINNFSQLPSALLIPMATLAAPESINKGASLTLTFDCKAMNLKLVSELNADLDGLANHLSPNQEFEVLEIKRGSLVQTIVGYFPDLLLVGGSIYALSKATLSIVKPTVEIRKDLAETRKVNLEYEKLKSEVKKQSDDAKELAILRHQQYLKMLVDEGFDDQVVMQRVSDELEQTIENKEIVKQISAIDSKYVIKEVILKL